MTVSRVLPGSSDSTAGSAYTDRVKEEVSALWDRSVCTLTSIGGTANAITAILAPALSAGLVEGMGFWLTPAVDTTGAATIAINGGSAVSIVDAAGAALPAGALKSGRRYLLVYDATASKLRALGTSEAREFGGACSDETTALTIGAAKLTFHMPVAFVATSVIAGLSTPQASGTIFTVDINKNGVTILSTKLTIDNTEETSLTAAAAAVISVPLFAKGDKVTIDIDQVGNGSAKGLKVWLIGARA
jgi:hypothetical protein